MYRPRGLFDDTIDIQYGQKNKYYLYNRAKGWLTHLMHLLTTHATALTPLARATVTELG